VPTNIPLHRQIVRDLDFIAGRFDTSYLDQKLEKFNLDAINNMEEEEQKMAHITKLVETIKSNNINVRH
jgi:pyruvate carboxylase subunit A